MKASGLRTCNTVKESSTGVMGLFILGTMKKGKSPDVGSLFGMTRLVIRENSRKTRFMDLEFICGKMEGSRKGCGKIIRCMGKELLLGLMEGFIKDAMLMIRRKDMGIFIGRMEKFIKGHGLMENSMGLGSMEMGKEMD